MANATATTPGTPARSRPARAEPAITAAAWGSRLLVATGATSIVSSALGVIVVPGLRGNAAERTVVLWERVSGTLGYVTMALVVALVCGAAFEVARSPRIHVVFRIASVAFAGLALALASQGLVARLHPAAALALLTAASAGVGVAGAASVRARHTRAGGFVLLALALAATCHGLAWALAGYAGEHARAGLYAAARGISTAGVALETTAHVVAVSWLTIRGRWRARVSVYLAVLVALALTIVALRAEAGPTFGGVLRAGIVDAQAHPLPYGLLAAARFLAPASLLLAASALGGDPKLLPTTAVLALAIASHARFDMPIAALMGVAAGLWLALIAADPPRT